ncbi:MAG: RHS repeat domain-containing protein [Hyphococcus sp.]
MRVFLMTSAAVALACTPVWADRIEYEYDVHGRLVKVDRCGADDDCSTNADDTTTEYTYDKADNREEKKVTTPPSPP